MHTLQATLDHLATSGLLAGMRGNFPPETALRVTDALMRAGIRAFEFTMNSVQPLQAMGAVKRAYGDDAFVGMGTVLDADTAQRVLDAGAEMIIAPSLDRAVIELAHRYDVLAVPGVMTPTECVEAWKAGAKLLKIFPIGNLGVEYFKSIRAPLDHIRFICNGGMTDQNVGAFMQAGATACGMAAWLTGDGTMSLNVIADRARTLRELVDKARQPQRMASVRA